MATKKDPEIAKLEKRAKAAREKVKTAKLYKELGLKPMRDFSTRAVKVRLKERAQALPKEKRQEILDAYHDRENPDCQTYGAMMAKCGVSLDQILGVIELNTKIYRYSVVEKETK